MHHYFKGVARQYRIHFSRYSFWSSVLASFVTFCAGVTVNSYAIIYATEKASNPVTDVVLSNIPVFNVDGLFVWGIVLLIIFITAVLLLNPKCIPFSLYSLGLFFAIRAMFISLTHVGPFPTQTAVDFTSNVGLLLSKIFLTGDDLFFSAHTGAPFLMALLFWQSKLLRYIFLASSVFFGAIALLGHIHYSIDVVSAFFITFSIYNIALWLFPKEHMLFLSKE
ncbi:MAG: hypothetical protein KGH79_04015 [Patescibacteria group bacterium]|nr:hypothetical protein [Patescibacteria group bacterium]